MRTAKKRHYETGGWTTTVTTDDGLELAVGLRRGPYKRNWFGRDSYYWEASVSGPGWSHLFYARRDDSARMLARRGLRMEAQLSGDR